MKSEVIDFGPLEKEQIDRMKRARDMEVDEVESNVEWIVMNTKKGHGYSVLHINGEWLCGCEDFQRRQRECKHVYAVVFYEKGKKLQCEIESNKQKEVEEKKEIVDFSEKIVSFKEAEKMKSEQKSMFEVEDKKLEHSRGITGDDSKVTVNGYDQYVVISAIQKEIRAGDELGAMFWAMELCESGLQSWMWSRLLIIASEDIGLADSSIAVTIRALYENCKAASFNKNEPVMNIVAHAVMLLARAPKNRICDDVEGVVCNMRKRGYRRELPPISMDVHTRVGQKKLRKLANMTGIPYDMLKEIVFYGLGTKKLIAAQFKSVYKDVEYHAQVLESYGISEADCDTIKEEEWAKL